MLQTAIGRLRVVSFIEGISTLLLFLIAVPLKYGAGWDKLITPVGRTHGGLVIVFCIALWLAMRAHHWPIPKAAKLFAASLFPFGFLWIEKKLREELKGG